MYIYNEKFHAYLSRIFLCTSTVGAFDASVSWCNNPFHAIRLSSEDEALAVIDFLIDVIDCELEGYLVVDDRTGDQTADQTAGPESA